MKFAEQRAVILDTTEGVITQQVQHSSHRTILSTLNYVCMQHLRDFNLICVAFPSRPSDFDELWPGKLVVSVFGKKFTLIFARHADLCI